MTLKVKNSSDAIVNIQEGNAGVFRTQASVRPQKTHTLKLDGNATYREYVLITIGNVEVGQAFSSDDALEYSEIEVIKNEKDEYVWKGKSKHRQVQRTNTNQGPGTNTNQGPGTSTNQGPGTNTNQAPGTDTNQGPGTSTNQAPGIKTEQAPQTSSKTKQVASSKSGGSFHWLRNLFKKSTS